jgi:glycolate oxidase
MCLPVIPTMPRRSCCVNWTGRVKMSPPRSNAPARYSRKPARSICASPATRRSASVSGPAARPPFRPWAACRRTTTAWMAPYRAGTWQGCSRRSECYRRRTVCRSATYSTPATATCTPSYSTTPTSRGNSNAPRSWRQDARVVRRRRRAIPVSTAGHWKINQMCVQFNGELAQFHAVGGR